MHSTIKECRKTIQLQKEILKEKDEEIQALRFALRKKQSAIEKKASDLAESFGFVFV